MSNSGQATTLLGGASVGTILSVLIADFESAEAGVITTVSAWFAGELAKLSTSALGQINSALQHFISALKAGTAWGEAMASMLTEVWNGVQSDLATLATDFVEAVGKVLQTLGWV